MTPYDPQLRARLAQYIAAGAAGTLAGTIDYRDLRELSDLAREAAGHLEAAAIERACVDEVLALEGPT